MSMTNQISILQDEAIALLRQLIAIPSFSREEEATASLLGKFFAEKGIAASRVGNNIFSTNKYYTAGKPRCVISAKRRRS